MPGLLCEARIVDDEGREVPHGTSGEIVVRGPNVFCGYWRNEAATAEALREGWYHSGDIAVRDADGYFHVRDRKKNLIISGGENIYPAEIENVLAGHPAVAEVAVIGVPDDKWGETVKAVVVLKASQHVAEADIIAFGKARLAGYKCPTSVDFVAALPRNPSGKVLKRDLRAPYWAAKTRRIN